MLLEKITKTLAALEMEETISLTIQATSEDLPPQEIILHGLFPGLEKVARRYQENSHLYPDIYKASIIFHEALAMIKHQIVSMKTNPDVHGAIGVVFGDMQDLGKNIVHMTLEAHGFTVKDLGKSVPAEGFLQAVREGADFIAISIMTDAGVEEAKKVVGQLRRASVRKPLKIIVGGAGVNAAKADEIIGADGYAESADEVVEFLKIFYQDNTPQ